MGEKSSLHDVFAEFGSVDVRGQDSGNAADLANYILTDLRDEPCSQLLYLTGDKNRDTMAQVLANSNIKLEPLQVYQTQNILPSGPTTLLPARVAAIGPTTNSFLTDNLHQRVDVVAQKPSSEELVAAIMCFDQRSNS